MLEKIVLLYFTFYLKVYNHDKFIRLTIFHCECMATQNSVSHSGWFWHFFTKSILLLLSVCIPSFTQLSVVINAADRDIYHEVVRTNYRIHRLSRCECTFWVWTPFLGYQSTKITSSLKIRMNIFCILLYKASACKFTHSKTCM